VEKIELGARLKDEAELLLGVEVAELSWYFLERASLPLVGCLCSSLDYCMILLHSTVERCVWVRVVLVYCSYS
jgi:hypothetical protein